MKKLSAINSKMLFSNYWYEQSRKRFMLEQVIFFAGVLLTVVIPEYFYSVSRGRVAFAIFAVTGVTGAVWGVVRYYRSPFRITECRIKTVVPRNPSNVDSPLKWAA